jgi:glycosyltransferase involved in cell wall biosynthesis
MTPTVSIIIPVYNVEKYLRECLDSVVAQTFKDWECILVDDGSKDGSPAICDEYAQRDPRFTVIHKENGGPSKARNAGLDVVRGEWISFIDADDWVDDGFFDEISVYPNADIIYFGFKQISDNRHIDYQITGQTYFTSEGLSKIYADLFESKVQYFGYTWNKFFKRVIIENYGIRFPENLVHKEDEVFSLRYSHHVKNMVISSKIAYNYRIHPASVTHCDAFFYDYCKLADYIETELPHSTFPELQQAINKRLIKYRFGAVVEDRGTARFDTTYKQYITFCRRHSSALSLTQRIKIWCPILLSKWWYCYRLK